MSTTTTLYRTKEPHFAWAKTTEKC